MTKLVAKELSFCHMCQMLKSNLSSTTLGCCNMRMRKSELMAKTQLLLIIRKLSHKLIVIMIIPRQKNKLQNKRLENFFIHSLFILYSFFIHSLFIIWIANSIPVKCMYVTYATYSWLFKVAVKSACVGNPNRN